MMVLEGCTEIGDPLREGDIQTKVEDPLTVEDILIEDILVMKDPLEEDILIEMENPLEEEDTLTDDPQMVEDLLVMEDPLDLLVDKDHWALRTTWTSKNNNSTNSPGDAGYITFREYL